MPNSTGGLPQDDKKACEWHRKAAEQGHGNAQDDLGCMYLLGRGVSQNRKIGLEWLEKASKQGAGCATNTLAKAKALSDKELANYVKTSCTFVVGFAVES